MKKQLILALLIAASLPALAQSRHLREPVLQVQAPEYSAQLAAERRELLRILGRTKVCMFDATTAARHEISRQRQRQRRKEDAERVVKGFVKDMCSGALRPYLINTARWSSADAEELIDELVEREVAASTSWGTP